MVPIMFSMKNSRVKVNLWGWVMVLLVLAACGPTAAPPTATIPPATAVSLSCGELVTAAIEKASDNCQQLGRNQACYGNALVKAEFQAGANVTFDQAGDLADLTLINGLSTAALDEVAQQWGIAILKAQANLSDSLPGQNVTFLVFGNTTVNNLSPDMQAVILRTDQGTTSCVDAAQAGLLIQSPDGVTSQLRINGADIRLGSTAYLTAQVNSEMSIAVVEGSAEVSSNAITRRIQPGAQVRVPLGGSDGLQVVGPPSEPEPFDNVNIARAPINLLERPVTIPAPIPTRSATVTPIPQSTPQPTPTITLAAGNPNLRADQTTLVAGQCTTIRWDTTNASQVLFQGQPTRSSEQQVCPAADTTYNLLLIFDDGSRQPYTIRVVVQQPTSTGS